ncbi:MAG TPA: L-threonylcarbamoyladenylate synthase [Tepidisphaeraceae bacterium]
MTDIDRAVQLLKAGRLVAFPTETVYGLGADATNPAAIERIYRTKGRPPTNPLIVHVPSIDAARRCVTDWPEIASRLAGHFWPGPLTIVLPKSPVIPDNATAGLKTVGLRVPNHPLALHLLRAFDGPLAAPSANRSTHVSPTTAQHVREEFPHPADEPALILDGGPCTIGIESTVLDLSTGTPTILRPGQIGPDQLEPLIGPVRQPAQTSTAATPATSPGQQEIHYAPRTKTFRFDTSQRGMILPDDNGIIVLSPLRIYKEWGSIIAMPNDPVEYAQHLYAVLRKLDLMNLQTIYIEMPPNQPQWAALRDRITRATRPLPKI